VPETSRAGVAPGPVQRICNQRGQALVEMGLIVVILVTLVMGVMELGRTWMVANMITNAARDGARAAALTPPSGRDPNTKLVNTASKNNITSTVHAQIANVLGASAANALVVNVDPADTGGTPMVRVRVTGSVNYVFNLLGSTFAVDKSVTFRDEGR
jgi:Flp pilus assembly protein TadG